MSARSVRLVDLCPVCQRQYGLSELDWGPAVPVHYLCNPANAEEYRSVVASVEPGWTVGA